MSDKERHKPRRDDPYPLDSYSSDDANEHGYKTPPSTKPSRGNSPWTGSETDPKAMRGNRESLRDELQHGNQNPRHQYGKDDDSDESTEKDKDFRNRNHRDMRGTQQRNVGDFRNYKDSDSEDDDDDHYEGRNTTRRLVVRTGHTRSKESGGRTFLSDRNQESESDEDEYSQNLLKEKKNETRRERSSESESRKGRERARAEKGSAGRGRNDLSQDSESEKETRNRGKTERQVPEDFAPRRLEKTSQVNNLSESEEEVVDAGHKRVPEEFTPKRVNNTSRLRNYESEEESSDDHRKIKGEIPEDFSPRKLKNSVQMDSEAESEDEEKKTVTHKGKALTKSYSSKRRDEGSSGSDNDDGLRNKNVSKTNNRTNSSQNTHRKDSEDSHHNFSTSKASSNKLRTENHDGNRREKTSPRRTDHSQRKEDSDESDHEQYSREKEELARYSKTSDSRMNNKGKSFQSYGDSESESDEYEKNTKGKIPERKETKGFEKEYGGRSKNKSSCSGESESESEEHQKRNKGKVRDKKKEAVESEKEHKKKSKRRVPHHPSEDSGSDSDEYERDAKDKLRERKKEAVEPERDSQGSQKRGKKTTLHPTYETSSNQNNEKGRRKMKTSQSGRNERRYDSEYSDYDETSSQGGRMRGQRHDKFSDSEEGNSRGGRTRRQHHECPDSDERNSQGSRTRRQHHNEYPDSDERSSQGGRSRHHRRNEHSDYKEFDQSESCDSSYSSKHSHNKKYSKKNKVYDEGGGEDGQSGRRSTQGRKMSREDYSEDSRPRKIKQKNENLYTSDEYTKSRHKSSKGQNYTDENEMRGDEYREKSKNYRRRNSFDDEDGFERQEGTMRRSLREKGRNYPDADIDKEKCKDETPRVPHRHYRRDCSEEEGSYYLKENQDDETRRRKYRNRRGETSPMYDGQRDEPYDHRNYEDAYPKQSRGGNRSDSSSQYEYDQFQRSKYNYDRGYKREEEPPQRERPIFSAANLIALLTKTSKLEVSLERLLKKCGLREKEVMRVVRENPELFEVVENDRILLNPKIKVCNSHLSQGCKNKQSCYDLHICLRFIHSSCNFSDRCLHGHTLSTKHNRLILQEFMLDQLPGAVLMKILEKCIPSQNSGRQLKVCYDYNNGSCSRSHCFYLHICEKFVTQNCSNSSCRLSHNLVSHLNRQILQNHGVDVNESPRDILRYIKDNFPPLCRQQRPFPSNESRQSDHRENSDKFSQGAGRPSTPETGQGASNRNASGFEHGNNFARGEMQNNVSGGGSSGTIWSHYYLGNVTVPEICYYSVTGKCRHEEDGCRRLHAKEHFHWQVRERGKGWVNLRKCQVDALEKAFGDPAQDVTNVPSVNPKNCPPGIFNLFGSDSWQAHFPSMMLGNLKTKVKLDMRRLCSENVDGKVPASCFQWYFLDQNGTWVEYGNVDTTKRDFLKSSITSQDIEKQYLQNKSSPLTFQNQMFTYVLDFTKMTQVNTTTGVKREVRRRPMSQTKKTGILSFFWKS